MPTAEHERVKHKSPQEHFKFTACATGLVAKLVLTESKDTVFLLGNGCGSWEVGRHAGPDRSCQDSRLFFNSISDSCIFGCGMVLPEYSQSEGSGSLVKLPLVL